MRKEGDLSGGRCDGGLRDGDDESGGETAVGKGCIDIATTRHTGLWLTLAGRARNLTVRALAEMRPLRQGYPFDGPGRDDPGQVMSGNSGTPENGGAND
jgi:hypothetical protein